jgi:hypothetical protein
MKSALALMLIVCLTGSAMPVTAQGQTEKPTAFSFRALGLEAGPLARAVTREAARLAAEDVAPSVASAGGDKSGQSNWSRVRDLEGEEILLTVSGSPPGKRYVVRGTVDQFGLTVLNLTDSSIPVAVTDALAGAAWWHADYFGLARRGSTVRLDKHVRLAPDGVFLDDRKVAELEQVVQLVARDSVAEIRHVHRAIKRGMAWGALIGGLAGIAMTNWHCHGENDAAGCGNLNGIMVIFGPAMGLGIGSGIGATFKISTVVYRAP